MTGGAPGSARIRALLIAFPVAFRARFGAGMEFALRCEWEEARSAGRAATLWFWVRAVASLAFHGCMERLFGDAGASRSPEKRKGNSIMGSTAREIRYALRRLARSPGFALTALITLGLGIGATTAIFSVVYAVILRPLPYEDPGGVVVVAHVSPTDELGVPAAGWFHYTERSRTLADFAIYIESSASISGTGQPLELGLIEATPSLLDVLGVSPVMGRGLTAEDSRPGADPVALVSHGYWVRQLGSDPDVLGKPALEGSPPVVVGVLPEGFEFERPAATVVFGNPFDAPDIILPLDDVDRSAARFGNFMYQGVARLAPGVTPEEAQAELSGLMLEAADAYPGAFTRAELEEGGYRSRVLPFKDAMVGHLAGILWILLGAVSFVLLIATANVANLFLVRAESRRDELAIRRAMGASRAALARTFLTESVLLGAAGGVLGIALATVSTSALLQLAPNDIPRADGLAIDFRVLAFAAGLSVLTGLVFGLAPLVRRENRNQSGLLGEHSRGGTAGMRASRSRRVLVVTQVAFAAVLLIGSGLLVRTFQNLRNVDPGFDGSHTVTLKLALSGSLLRAAGRTETAADAARSRFMLDLSGRLARIPGVEDVSFAADLPLDGVEFHDYVAIEGRIPSGLERATKALRVFIGPGYFDAIGARLLQGRELEEREFVDQPRSVVVNHAFANERFAGGDPIGHRVMQYFPGIDPTLDIWYTIVGVVDDIRETSLMTPAEPTVYLPTIFLPDGDFAMWVSNMIAVVRVSGDPLAMLPRLRTEVQAAYPEIPISALATLDHITSRSFQQVSFAMSILVIAAALALLLGIVGIYGTVSYVVGQRTREFGLRIALGASGWDVRRDVLRGGGTIALLGVGIGLVAALIASRVVRSLLFGVSSTDPLVYTAVAAILTLLVLAASMVPAARAASVDPAEAMRAE